MKRFIGIAIYVFFVNIILSNAFIIETESIRINKVKFEKLIVDRLEGNYAVCENENGDMFSLKKDLLPSGFKEGDVININNNKMIIDKIVTMKQKIRAEKLFKKCVDSKKLLDSK